jgi:hypothetical protein
LYPSIFPKSNFIPSFSCSVNSQRLPDKLKVPGLDYAGTVRFSYTISDGEGNSDKAKVTVIIKAPTDRTMDQSGQGQDQDVQGNQHEPEVKTQHKNQLDNKAPSELSSQEFHRDGGTNDTDNNIR